MPLPYVEVPSENFAEREGQVPDYAPRLCYSLGRTHKAYGWVRYPSHWDADQRAAYDAGYYGEPCPQ